MEEMTMDQIALAAECITLARVEFARATFLSPLEQVVESLAGVKVKGTEPESEADRIRRRTRERTRRPERKPPPRKKKTAEERDAAIYAMAKRLGYPIEEEPKKG